MWDTQTGRSKFIRDFQNFVGPNPVRGSKILTSYGPWIPDIGFTWRSNVWSRKQFEGVQYSMFDMLHKCTFGPDSQMITCQIAVMVHFQVVPIRTFKVNQNCGPI